ncbi:hypothetical protein EB796_020766 [Bugula neritina]|uniref:Uncharacterized protein n=1 Tax=Bugula neritina TaxID=10212 RepID=A0A7J7J4C9_BUGNE|nr:hypothetical protein EB796_020766 [Bugula neritina]
MLGKYCMVKYLIKIAEVTKYVISQVSAMSIKHHKTAVEHVEYYVDCSCSIGCLSQVWTKETSESPEQCQ